MEIPGVVIAKVYAEEREKMRCRKKTEKKKKCELSGWEKIQERCVVLGIIALLGILEIMSFASRSLSGMIKAEIWEGQQELNVWMEENDMWIFLPAGCEEAVWKIPENSGHSWSIDGEKLENGSRIEGKEGQSAELVEEGIFGLKSWNYRIHVLKSEKIPSLYLETESESMEYLHKTKENSEKGYIRTVDESGKESYEGEVFKIKGRGNYTWLLDKKSYTLTFSKPVGMLGMQERKQWVLAACADEDTHMINRMVFEMMREAGIENVQESRWVDVFLNGEYAGNYLLTQKVEVPADGEHGDWLAEFDGYWMEEGNIGFITEEGESVAIIEPENASEKKQREISGFFEKVEEELTPEGDGDWRQFLDEESIVKKYILDEIGKCPDGFNGSNYCYLKNGKLYFAAPWDYEFSFGNQPRGYTELELPDGLYHQAETLWYRRLWRDEKFQQAVINEYESFFEPYLKQMEEKGLDQWAEEINASMKMDAVRWGRGKENFRSEVEEVKGFIAERLSWLDQEWLGKGDGKIGTYHTLTLMNGDEIEQIYYIRDGSYVEKRMLEWDNEHFCGWFEDENYLKEESILGKTVHEDIVLYAKISHLAARMELIMGMVPLGILLAVLAIWMIYSVKENR